MPLHDRLATPLVRLPVDVPVANALADEFAALPSARRRAAVRKLWQREGLLLASGQAALRRERVPADARRVLWIVTWTTVGDAILDLAARALVPPEVELDLCIAPALAPLFAYDTRFARVHVDPARCGAAYDLVLLDVLSTASIRLKARHFARLPFATLRGHLLGERFDRAAFGDRRVRRLFDLPPGDVTAPWLALGPSAGGRAEGSSPVVRIAVPLGARVAEKRYPRWPEALAAVVEAWPAGTAPPRFALLGHGPSAHAELTSFDAGFLARHATVAVDDRGTLGDAALTIAGCEAFLGIDGGLMHVAVALGVPGLAVFAGVDPRWFLRPGSSMAALRLDGPPAALDPVALATRFVAGLSGSASID